MAGSLQDQLLNAGLADAKKAKQLAKEKRKESRVARRSGVEVVDEAKVAAQEALADKAQRARALNEERNADAQRKAVNAQIRQLIDNHRVPRDRGDIGFNFTDGKKVKKLYVTGMQQKQLSAGNLAIARQGDGHELVPAPVASKIAERDSSRVIFCQESGDSGLTEEEQDWYKDYDIPDDLMW
ncbi:MAG: DUF2058 domain-containing protein [Chromatocurvus sp.]